jgi:hypothetical protein
MKRVVVHIDRLILNGFRPDDRRGISKGLQSELAHVLATPLAGERLASLGNVPNIRAGRITLTQDVNPQATGVTAARAISKELSR